jgi:hypothetical protein
MNLGEQFENQIDQLNSLEDLTQVLQRLLSGGYNVWFDGRLMYIKELVDRVDGLRIIINPREHTPPHFHVRGVDINALFSIEDCQLIKGTIAPRQEHLIRW